MFILNDDKANFYRGHPPLVILDKDEYFVAPKGLWKDGSEAVARLQFCRAPCLGPAPLREWIATCFEMVEDIVDCDLDVDQVETCCLEMEESGKGVT